MCRPDDFPPYDDPTATRAEPRPVVQLSGRDGNAFAVMGAVRSALKRAGASQAHISAFTDEAMAGDYDHLLATAMKYADVR